MATSRIVFYDSPNAPRNSRVKCGFGVSSHRIVGFIRRERRDFAVVLER